MKELKDYILGELAGEDGWWKDGHESFVELAELLYQLHVPIEEIKTQLSNIYSAVAAEFGN